MMLARAADFQAAWYLSLIALVILGIVVGAGAWVLAGARRMWRAGDHGPATLIAAATVFSLLAFLGMYAAALGGLILNSSSAGGGG